MNWLSAETEEEPAGRGGKGLPRASSLGSGRPENTQQRRRGVSGPPEGESQLQRHRCMAPCTSPNFSAWPLTSSGGGVVLTGQGHCKGETA